jgi:shikimate kinase
MRTSAHSNAILLVGHRGTGKTTLGPMIADALGSDWKFIDLDAAIEEREGRTPAEIVANDEAEFRRLESAQLQRILASSSNSSANSSRRVIAVGAGCQSLPAGPLYVWLWRDGWEQSALEGRARLRPEYGFSREVSWMRENREPRWSAAAHLFFRIPRARAPQFAADMVADYVRWALDAHKSPIAGRSWMVPQDSGQLERAGEDARRFGLAGVEVRSDFYADSGSFAGAANDSESLETPILASVRSEDPRWLEQICTGRIGARQIDVDLAFLAGILDAGVLDKIAPRPIILSAHPPGLGEDAAQNLVNQAREVARAAPKWAPFIELKYAPTPETFAQLRRAFEIAERLRESGWPVTFLPQGARFAWTRPILARSFNTHNYLPVGLRASRLPARNSAPHGPAPSPMDLQDWLPYFAETEEAAGESQHFDGLIGDPVSASMGDWWHTRASILESRPGAYLKIPLGRDDDDAEMDEAFKLFEDLGLRGLSVTSPLKRRVPRIVQGSANQCDDAPLNTLRRVQSGWIGCDTDEIGMLATLKAVEAESDEQNSATARTAAIIGRGGVSPAIVRAVEAAGWTLVEHVGARRGWGVDGPERVQLVINAAGARPGVSDNAPACELWLDLHYHGVGPTPACAARHQNGDVFFEAQARAQREFWRRETVFSSTIPSSSPFDK